MRTTLLLNGVVSWACARVYARVCAGAAPNLYIYIHTVAIAMMIAFEERSWAGVFFLSTRVQTPKELNFLRQFIARHCKRCTTRSSCTG